MMLCTHISKGTGQNDNDDALDFELKAKIHLQQCAKSVY